MDKEKLSAREAALIAAARREAEARKGSAPAAVIPRAAAAAARGAGKADGEPRRAAGAAHGRGARRDRAQEEEDAALRDHHSGGDHRDLRPLGAESGFAPPLMLSPRLRNGHPRGLVTMEPR